MVIKMIEQETKSLITETAFKLFLDKGYRNTSMRDLVEATNLSKGAFYHYFKNKEKIYEDVIDIYFLSYYRQVDWDAVEQLNINEIEHMMQTFYQSFIPTTILSITQKGLSRYFILFFESFEIHPTFKTEIQQFYTKLRQILSAVLEKAGHKNAKLEALQRIVKFEGMVFWSAVFPEHPPMNI